MHPAQQQGLRFPADKFSSMIRILRARVSDFFADIIQHNHSLRASGVISCHVVSTCKLVGSNLFKSVGTVCTIPLGILFRTGIICCCFIVCILADFLYIHRPPPRIIYKNSDILSLFLLLYF